MADSPNIQVREQCFLSLHMDELASRNNAESRGASSAALDITSQEYQDRVAAHQEQYNERARRSIPDANIEIRGGSLAYQNFVSVITTNPATLINSLVSSPGVAGLFHLTPAQMSSLMPKMRFFKVLYENEDDRVGRNVEFVFKKHYDENDVRTMIADRKGRGQGVGIKSFEWELIGTNTAEVDNNIKAKLKIFFQNFKDFVDDGALEFVNADPDPNRAFSTLEDYLGSDSANYLDLIFRTSKFREGEGSTREFNERYYRIKSVLGWSIDPALVGNGPGKLFTPDAKREIESTGTTLLLSLLAHDIDFREDGTVELTLEYHAAVESMMTSKNSNILYASRRQSAAGTGSSDYVTLQMIEQRLAFLNDERAEIDARGEDSPDIPTEDPTSEEDCVEPYEGSDDDPGGVRGWWRNRQDRGEVDNSIQRLELERRRIRAEIYNRMLTEMTRGGRMFYVDISEAWIEAEDLATASIRATNFSRDYGPAGDSGTALIGSVTGAITDAAAEDDPDDPDIDLEGVSLPYTEPRRSYHRVHFFYLGDLIDVALDILKRNDNPEEFKDIRLVLGTLAIPGHPGRGEEVGKINLINIADIPISLNLFLNFYVDRVVSRDRSNWPLKTFLKEVFSSLIYPSLGDRCVSMPEGSRRQLFRSNLSITNLSAYSDADGRDRLLSAQAGSPTEIPGGDRDFFGFRRVFAEDIPSMMDDAGRVPIEDRTLFHYIVVQASDYSTLGRDATLPDAAEHDAAEGVYWLNIGNDRGLVKSIKFKKTDQPGLREARMEREGTIGLGQLREKYDADVNLFGNSLFQPGQVIYLNPTVVGLHSTETSTRLSSILGVGGYHQIISVDNGIDENTYETVLNTKWVASGVPGFDSEDESNECPSPWELEIDTTIEIPSRDPNPEREADIQAGVEQLHDWAGVIRAAHNQHHPESAAWLTSDYERFLRSTRRALENYINREAADGDDVHGNRSLGSRHDVDTVIDNWIMNGGSLVHNTGGRNRFIWQLESRKPLNADSRTVDNRLQRMIDSSYGEESVYNIRGDEWDPEDRWG